MLQYGNTIAGEIVLEACHQACRSVIETRGLLFVQIFVNLTGKIVICVGQEEAKHMYEMGRKVIYG